jgi:hypothetical protein
LTTTQATTCTKESTQTAKQGLQQAKEEAEERKKYEDWPKPPAPPPVPEALTLLMTDDIIWLFPKAQFHHMLTAGVVRRTMSMWGVPVPKDIQAAEHSMAVLLKLPPEPTEQYTLPSAAKAAAAASKQQPSAPAAASHKAPGSAGPTTPKDHAEQQQKQQPQQQAQPADRKASTSSCKHPSITPATLQYALPQHYFSSPQQQLLATAAQELHELRIGRGMRCSADDTRPQPSHTAEGEFVCFGHCPLSELRQGYCCTANACTLLDTTAQCSVLLSCKLCHPAQTSGRSTT